MASFFMPVKDLVANYAPVYPDGGTWEDTVELLTSDPVENRTVQALMKVLREEGGYRTPISLREGEDDYGNPTRVFYVGDGTHRTVAAILCGVDEVLVETENPENVAPDEYPPYVKVKVATDDPGLKTDLFETLFDKLRSFPINDHIWVVADVIVGNKQGVEFLYTGVEETPGVETRVFPKIIEKFKEELATFPQTATKPTITIQFTDLTEDD